MNVLKPAGIIGHRVRILLQRATRNIHQQPKYAHLFKQFHATYPALKNFLCNKIEGDWARETYSQMLDYQLRSGRQIKPAVVLKVHEIMTPGYSSDVELGSFQRIHVMAWIVETLHAAALLADDFVDDSKSRRGVTPWHVGRGNAFSNDLILMILTPYHLLQGWFGKDSFYHTAATLLQKHACTMIVGQQAENYVIDLFKKRKLTFEIFRSYCISKNIYASDLSFKLAAFESTKLDLQFDEITNVVLEDLAYLYQFENDAMNVLPQKFSHGKDFDEDIKSGKVTWSLTFLMNNATEKDQNIIMEHYGKADQKSVDTIRDIYDKYNIPNETLKSIENLKNSISEKIRMVPDKHRFQQGLNEAFETLKLYPKLDSTVRYVYPKA